MFNEGINALGSQPISDTDPQLWFVVRAFAPNHDHCFEISGFTRFGHNPGRDLLRDSGELAPIDRPQLAGEVGWC
jgi:hypothetical protein